MNISRVRCDFCRQPRQFNIGVHGCPQSLAAQARLSEAIAGCAAVGTNQPRTSEPWSHKRSGHFDDIAQRIKITGGGVKPQN